MHKIIAENVEQKLDKGTCALIEPMKIS